MSVKNGKKLLSTMKCIIVDFMRTASVSFCCACFTGPRAIYAITEIFAVWPMLCAKTLGLLYYLLLGARPLSILQARGDDMYANAFVFGVGGRHERCLEHKPGLWIRVHAVSTPTPTGKLRLVGRSTLCNELMTQLDEDYGFTGRCIISFGGAVILILIVKS
jgi:hypothetical protein